MMVDEILRQMDSTCSFKDCECENKYSLTDIKALWAKYQNARAWRVLRKGKWHVYKKAPDTTDGATRTEMIKLKDHIDFPKFMELFKDG